MRDKIHNNGNCYQVTNYVCNKCGTEFLTDAKTAKNCIVAKCKGTLEGKGSIVVGLVTCTHSFNRDGHEYK